jgi:hypothetical protein
VQGLLVRFLLAGLAGEFGALGPAVFDAGLDPFGFRGGDVDCSWGGGHGWLVFLFFGFTALEILCVPVLTSVVSSF